MDYHFVVRPATRSDHEKIVDIWRRSLRSHGKIDENDIHKLLRSSFRYCYVAELSGTGIICGFVFWYLERDGCAVEHLAVHPEWTRLGIGRRLIESMVSNVDRRFFTLVTRESEIEAQALAKSCGFDLTEIRSTGHGDGGGVMFYRLPKKIPTEL